MGLLLLVFVSTARLQWPLDAVDDFVLGTRVWRIFAEVILLIDHCCRKSCRFDVFENGVIVQLPIDGSL